MSRSSRIVGQTRDTGFHIGVRRTFPIRQLQAWELLTSPRGARAWLGHAPDLEFAKNATFRLPDGTTGKVTVYVPGSHLRLTWQPGWPRASIMQLRVIPSGERTAIAFHQEHLPGPAERDQRRAHFAAALDKLERMVEKELGA
jgi:uncharacterized protein YndB with AHSA1/START domain